MLTFSNSINILKHLALYPLLDHAAKNCGVPIQVMVTHLKDLARSNREQWI
jgi:hypothetical protein